MCTCDDDLPYHTTEPERLALQLRLQGELLDHKYRALEAMPSQTASLIGALGSDVYRAWSSEESFVSAFDVPGDAFVGPSALRYPTAGHELVAA